MNKLFILLLALFVTSCTATNYAPEETFRVGTQGLDIDFFQGIFDQPLPTGRFTIALEVLNEGAYDVQQGYVVIATEQPYVQVLGNDKKEFFLRGRSPLYPDGEAIDLTFQTEVASLPPGSQEHQSILQATLCYDYQTKLTTDVCIDPDPYNIRQDPDTKTCRQQDVPGGSQGAPIAIDRVEIRPYLQQQDIYLPEFIIHISNIRNGLAFRYDRAQTACSTTNFQDGDLNKITVFAKLSETTLACDTPVVNLQDGKAIVRCGFQNAEFIDANRAAYTAPLYIELNYGYTETISQRFSIIE